MNEPQSNVPDFEISLNVVVKNFQDRFGQPFLGEIVCLHGWGQSHKSFIPLSEVLSPYCNLHLVDLPGFGLSPAPPSGWNTERYASRVLKYLDDNAVKEVSIIGHSFGGRVALRLAKLAPSRIKKLVLIASHGILRERNVWEKLKLKVILNVGKLVKTFDSLFSLRRFLGVTLYEGFFIPRFGSQDYINAGHLRDTLVKVVSEDQEPELPGILQPTLLLWGAEDEVTPLEMAYRFRKLIPNSSLIVLDAKGHDCFQDIDSHLCAFYIREFLSNSLDT